MTQAANPELFATSEWLATLSSLVLLWLTPLFVLGYPDQALKKQCWVIGMGPDTDSTSTELPMIWHSSYDVETETEKGDRQKGRWPQRPILPEICLFLPLTCALEVDR
ncbi:hypothetical protein BDP81DRAFT_417484 [Colletotrichum phormii]|uniref:Uncharacterized protein n=1 Tax=Colletotrichum phormii TaxID=359342 RepID=A0AAI9ZZP0_9PEZI|nr:uncharacterized protein BDP81DRAFT_417484 [Colletotrichum phormii]KAK1640821.1 hypothetical protein BDP81DRAFT_417484 [Colletotrichum phormii]